MTSPSTPAPALQPCPFCGGPASHAGAAIRCDNFGCNASMSPRWTREVVGSVKGDHDMRFALAKSDTANRWNHRADLHISPAAMLDLWDRSLSGTILTDPERQQVRQMVLAAAFGVAAYHIAMDTDEGAHAMMRAILLALVDPMHPDLGYLRAAAGAGISDGGRDG